MDELFDKIDKFQIIFGDQGGPTAPWWWMDAVFGWLMVCGLFIWLFGGKIVKPSLGFVGLLSGGGIVGLVGLTWFPTTPPALWFIGGALVGAIAFFLLHRLIMGLLIGFVAAMVLPITVSLVQQHPMPNFAAPIEAIGAQVKEKLSQNVRTDNSESIAAIAYQDLKDIIGTATTKTREVFSEWWGKLSGGAKTLVATSTAGGLILGLIIGMALPGMGGMLATSCIGAFFILLGVMRFGMTYLPESISAWLPSSSTHLVWTIAGATFIGLIIQWRIFRQPADE